MCVYIGEPVCVPETRSTTWTDTGAASVEAARIREVVLKPIVHRRRDCAGEGGIVDILLTVSHPAVPCSGHSHCDTIRGRIRRRNDPYRCGANGSEQASWRAGQHSPWYNLPPKLAIFRPDLKSKACIHGIISYSSTLAICESYH